MKDLSLVDLQESTKHIVPIKPEEQREAILAAQAGDTVVRDRILLSNIGLVVKLAQPFLASGAAVGLEAVDLVMAGLYGLPGKRRTGMIRAIEKFDVDRGFKLITYARHWIIDALQQVVYKASDWRTKKHVKRMLRTDCEELEEQGQEGDAEVKTLLGQGLAKLTAQQRFVVTMVHIEAVSINDIAEAMGKDPKAVKAIELEALARLREVLDA